MLDRYDIIDEQDLLAAAVATRFAPEPATA
jgi:hypothetical protein